MINLHYKTFFKDCTKALEKAAVQCRGEKLAQSSKPGSVDEFINVCSYISSLNISHPLKII